VKVLITGATGMVGQGVLRECLADPEVEQIITIGRTVTGISHPRLHEILHTNFVDFSAVHRQLAGLDACFFCLGVSSAGMSEADYARITFEFTLAAGEALAGLNPGMTFIYISGAGTDATEQGRTMWARVKGRTENALLKLPLKAYMFRPGLIQPLDGIRSKTRAYRVLYAGLRPLLPLLRMAFPSHVLTTRDIGQAMLAVARHGYSTPILEPRDIRAVLKPGH
jgi:uncharacterized protein YbjT (DUF2867 family)